MKQKSSQIESEKLIWFRSVCYNNGFPLTVDQLLQMSNYGQLLLDWNKRINLISRKDEDKIWDYHLLHSISLLFHFDIIPNSSIVDLGTGGGLPGIPLKIAMPEINLLCIDSISKKTDAVSQIIKELNLKGASAVRGRAEKLAKSSEYSFKYDYVVARSVAPLVNLISWSKNFLKEEREIDYVQPNVRMESEKILIKPPALITYKGGDLKEEIEEAKEKFKQISVQETVIKVKGVDLFEVADKKILVVRNL